MTQGTHIRQATENDIPFVVEAIMAAEKSGSSVLSYSTLYGLDESEVIHYLSEMVSEDIEGQELCLSQFLITETDQRPVACISTWIEGEHGNSSELKSALLGHYLPIDGLKQAAKFKTILNDLRIERVQGALQIECVYVAPDHRGKGLLSPLIQKAIESRPLPVAKVQLIVDGSNLRALRAYEKMGFELYLAKQTQDPTVMSILPSGKRCSMIMKT